METAYLVAHRSSCSTTEGSTKAKDSFSTGTVSSLRKGDPSSEPARKAGSGPAPAPLVAIDPLGFPEKCSAEQLKAMERQLPKTNCYRGPWAQECSFTVMTKGCQDPKLMREFYADQYAPAKGGDVPFLGVLVGWNLDDAPVDTLHVGSRDPKYDRSQWNAKSENKDASCKSNVTIPADRGGVRNSQILVVEWDDRRHEKLTQLVKDLAYTDEEILLDKTNPETAPQNTLSTLIESKFPAGEDRPIHYLAMDSGRENDFEIFTKQLSSDVLKNVRYLTFGYNWKRSWGNEDSKLLVLIERLKTEGGLVCYWSGDVSHPGFWRITDCWLSHYENKQWAKIACVSSRHDDVAVLRDRMETVFLEKLETNSRP
jgi:hypothetical protein